jgi:uncharacterized repeat protein (TIGR01451 family)
MGVLDDITGSFDEFCSCGDPIVWHQFIGGEWVETELPQVAAESLDNTQWRYHCPDGQSNSMTIQVGTVESPSILLTKTGDSSAVSVPPVVGGTITYTFTIENTGDTELTDVVVTDPDATISGSPIASLL